MDPLRLVCLSIVLAATIVGVRVFALGVTRIIRTVRVGRATEPGRLAPVGTRLLRVLRELVGHGRFQHKPVVRVAHWAVMVSFPILFLTVVTAYGQVLDPRFALPLVGHLAPVEWLIEAIAWLSFAGIVALVAIRLRRPRRFAGSNMAAAYYVEATVLGVVVCVLALRGLEHALAASDPATAHLATAWHFPLTGWIGSLLADVSVGALEDAVVVVATVKLLVSMAWFVVVGLQPTMGVAWHRFLALVTVYARREADGSPALGPLLPIRVPVAADEAAASEGVAGSDAARPDALVVTAETLEDLPDDARLGAGAIEDFTWKGLLDFATCTECGRCQEVCPAWNTGKPLSPKLVMTKLRDHAAATAPYLREGSTEHQLLPVVGVSGGGAPITPEELWDCTTCGACVEQCPVDLEQVDAIVDMRRYQVLMESAFPAELSTMFRGLETKQNPWNMAPRARLAWAKGLDFPVPVIGVDVEDATGLDYLFWVGCAGAYEDRAKATTRAVAELLDTAGVSFGVLGDGEACTGDPARRSGNEVLFQMLAAQNVETLAEVGAKAIVVTCAHCFNTLSREYPQLGGHYDVVHHTELLDRLVREGRLTPVAPGTTEPAPDGPTVTYHDPCYLGRHNKIYAPPRDLLGALPGVTVTEMPRNEERAMCCGAGGARAFMEETRGTRINESRSAEALATGADVVVTACPFCTVMLGDGVTALTSRDEDATPVEVVDVATVLLRSVKP